MQKINLVTYGALTVAQMKAELGDRRLVQDGTGVFYIADTWPLTFAELQEIKRGQRAAYEQRIGGAK